MVKTKKKRCWSCGSLVVIKWGQQHGKRRLGTLKELRKVVSLLQKQREKVFLAIAGCQ